jgi:hypothetical protein
MTCILALAAGVGLQTPARAPFADVPGVIIDHSPAVTRQYIGSPSIAVLPNGEYVVSHDLFGPGSTRDRTHILASSDRGKTWTRRAEIIGQWWSTLFCHRGALYIMGTSRENGYAVIRRSRDGGRTWTEPTDHEHGLLLNDGAYHCAPVPVVVHRGRIWRAMEDQKGPAGWGRCFGAMVLSAPERSNLLNAANWTHTSRIGYDPSWLNGTFGGWLEGNVVVTPDGALVNILRVESPDYEERAAMITISRDGKIASFDPSTGFIAFPGGAKKFTIRYDRRSGHYWSLANWVPPDKRTGKPASTRNTLALIRSRDLRQWEVRAVILEHPDPLSHGFQYVDWLVEGSDIIAVCRTAYDDGMGGANNFHDANFMTFHRVPNFRDLVGVQTRSGR